jgi:hypothetical protein
MARAAFRQPSVVPGIVVGVIPIRDQLERPVKFFPVPDGAGIDPLGRRHAPVADQVIEERGRDPDIGRRLGPRETAGRERGRQDGGALGHGAIGLGFGCPEDAGKGGRNEAENGRGRPVAGNDRRAAGVALLGGVLAGLA